VAGFEFSSNQKPLLYALIGLAAIGLSVSHVRHTSGEGSSGVVLREPGGRVIASGSEATPSPHPGPNNVTVHVIGCVRNPGLYTLSDDSRVAEAVDAAGGTTMNADLQAINLASRLSDGLQINVPAKTPIAMPASVQGQPSTSPPPGAVSTQTPAATPSMGKLKSPGDGIVHINSANAQELQRLPGVGPAIAQNILEYRARTGGFARPDQIIEVKGIGPKKWETMRQFVAL
jgi:competence protein ComEA